MSNSLTINTPNIVQQNTPLRNVPSGSTATPDYSVKFVPQDLTEAQQAQARQNIGAISESEIPASAQANWNETDTESPAYIQNKPTIPSAQVQSDWNQSDNAAVDYIKNKPTIPVLPIQANNNLPILIPEDFYNMIAVEGEVYEWGTDTDFSKSNWYQYVRGQLKDDSDSGNYLASQGYNIFVKKHGDLTSTSIKFGDKAGNYKIKIGTNELWTQGTYFFTENTAYTGNITIMWGYHAAEVYRHMFGGWKDCGLKLPICTSMYTYLMYNQWPKDGTGSRLYGNLVLVDKPFDLRGADNHDASLPDMTNVTAVYVPRSRSTEFASFMDYGYGSGNWSTIEAKVVYYDFLTWIDDMTPKVVVLPTVPLTMTDENSTVISGNFVAQNLTITPAV